MANSPTSPAAVPLDGESPSRNSPILPVYLDYNATAPLLPEARAALLAALDAYPGNPSSPHSFGQAARDYLETTRAQLAELTGCHRREVIFTSGGSESNNMALRWLAELPAGAHLVISAIEHPSVLAAAEWLAGQGVRVDKLPVSSTGVVRVEELAALLGPDTRLVSVMAANNETGVVQPLAEIAALVREAEAREGNRILLHCDGVQALGRIPLDWKAWGVDLLSVSAHKLGGPKGTGALCVREGVRLPGLILGGGQEKGLRAGTESVAQAAGFLAAAQVAVERADFHLKHWQAMGERLLAVLGGEPGFFLVGAEAQRLPNTLCLGFTGLSARSLLIALDLAKVAVSTGSACSSGALEPSHVLEAMGLPEEQLEGALRISMGHGTTTEDVARLGEALLGESRRLRASA